MAYSNPITWTTGSIVTASQLNTNLTANLQAIWKGTTNGDMDYYAGATTKSRLPIGTTAQILSVVSGVPTWINFPMVSGISSNIATDTTSTSFIDMANSTVTLTLTRTSTVFLFGFGTGTSSGADTLVVKGYIDGTNGQECLLRDSDAAVTIDAQMFIMQRKTGVAAGTRTLKLQYKSLGGADVHFYNGNVIGVAFPE